MSLRANLAAIAALVLFALACAANAQTTAYVDKNLFLANMAPGSYLQNFDALTPGNSYSNLAYSGGGFQYNVSAMLGLGAVVGNGGGAALSVADPSDDIQIDSTGNPITAIGGNFYNTDFNGGYVGGSLFFSLSNGTSFTIPLAAATGFIGFTVTSGSITSLRITGDSGGSQYATMDNLIVGSYAAAVTPPTPVSGRISLEGVANLSAVSSYAPLGKFHISFRKPKTTAEIYGFDVALTVSANSPFGTYSVSVPPGTYDVLTKGAKNLAVKSSGVVVGSASGTVPAVELPCGDANNDNSVDSSDFGLLIGAFNTMGKVAGSGYDPAEDFNFDGSVDSGDFGLLIGEFNNVGAK